MTTYTAICRTHHRTHIALAASVYCTADDVDDALDQINAHRPTNVRWRMTEHLRLERHVWDRKSFPPRRQEAEARSILIRIGYEEDLAAHLSAAMSAARGAK